MSVSKIISIFVAVRMLKLIGQKWTNTPAYKAGVVDGNGKRLVGRKDMTPAQKKEYEVLDRVAYNIKRMVSKFGVLSVPMALKLMETANDQDVIYLDEIEDLNEFVATVEALENATLTENKNVNID